MDFKELANIRQSCRNFDASKKVEKEKIKEIIDTAVLSPSACNSQPYFITVCTDENAKKVAKATQSMGMNKFSSDAPVMLVISEMPYVRSAAAGAKLKGNDYRSIDIGIVCSHIVYQASELGLSTCILGWFDDKKIRAICGLEHPVRLVVALGYAKTDDKIRAKKRKKTEDIVKYI
ncbi:MAG: nitroreductase family protein [Ruminococcus sp.]|nr:nitroreductase family protein [Ruminococcus sp.]